MSYSVIMQYASKRVVERLSKTMIEADFELYEPIDKADYIQLVYNHILHIALHYGNIDKAAADIYKSHAAIHGESTVFHQSVLQRVQNTAHNYSYEVDVMCKFYECYRLDAPDAVLMAFLDNKLK